MRVCWTAPIDQLWKPPVQSNSLVSLCVARSPIESGYAGDIVNLASRSSSIDCPDVVTLGGLAGLRQAKELRYEIRREDQTSFNDLRQGPAILIGRFNDSWTPRLMNQGRFSLQWEGLQCWIKNQQDPADKRWSIDLGHDDERGVPTLAEDLAMVSRVAHRKTGNVLVLVVGLWGYGAQAAGEFLTKGRFLEALAAQAPTGWEKKNMQVIIGTEVIDRYTWPPRILNVTSGRPSIAPLISFLTIKVRIEKKLPE